MALKLIYGWARSMVIVECEATLKSQFGDGQV